MSCEICGALRQALYATCRRLPSGEPGQALPAEVTAAVDEDCNAEVHQAALGALREHLAGCAGHQAAMREAAAGGTGVDYPSESSAWKRRQVMNHVYQEQTL